MRANAADHNKVVDVVRKSRIIPGAGIQLGRYSAGTAISVTPGTIKRRKPQRSGVLNLTGWRSFTAQVTARVDHSVLRKSLEWRQVVWENGSFRVARQDEAIMFDCGIPGQYIDLHAVPQTGYCTNLPDVTLSTPIRDPLGYDWYATSQWNPWTPIAGDIIRVYFNRDVVLAGIGFCCDEVKPVREETIFVTYCKRAGSTYVKPELYWLNMSLVGEPDADGIVSSTYTIYETTATAGRTRQTALQSGKVLLGGFSTQTNLYTGTIEGWSYRPLFNEGYTQDAVWGASVLPSGLGVVAGYVQISGQWKLRLFTEEVYQPSNRWTFSYLETQSSQFYVQHVACDSAGVVHILARNASTGAYRYITSDGVAEVPTTTTSPCALAISPAGVPTILGKDSAGVWGFMQRVSGSWVTTALTALGGAPGNTLNCVDVAFASDGTLHYAYAWYAGIGPFTSDGYIGTYNGVDSRQTVATDYDSNTRTRLAIDSRGYPAVAFSRLISGTSYECDLWIWKRDGLNDTYQSATIGNPYQLGAVHVVNGRGYDQ